MAAVPVSSPQLPGRHADMGLGRGSVNPELRMVVAPPLFPGFLIAEQQSLGGQCCTVSQESLLNTPPTACSAALPVVLGAPVPPPPAF